MNPWYQNLVDRCGREHDRQCVERSGCHVRAEHIDRVYVPHALRERVDKLLATRSELASKLEAEHARAEEAELQLAHADKRIRDLTAKWGTECGNFEEADEERNELRRVLVAVREIAKRDACMRDDLLAFLDAQELPESVPAGSAERAEAALAAAGVERQQREALGRAFDRALPVPVAALDETGPSKPRAKRFSELRSFGGMNGLSVVDAATNETMGQD